MTKRSSYKQVVLILFRITLVKKEGIAAKGVVLIREGKDRGATKTEEEIDLSLVQTVPLQVEGLQEAGLQAHRGHPVEHSNIYVYKFYHLKNQIKCKIILFFTFL